MTIPNVDLIEIVETKRTLYQVIGARDTDYALMVAMKTHNLKGSETLGLPEVVTNLGVSTDKTKATPHGNYREDN